jgi:hypothetical protein
MAVVTIQLKRGKAATWMAVNPVLAYGEPGFEGDTGRLKIGDGVSKWSELNYFGESDYYIAQTRYGFPSIGRSDVLYQAVEENAIYQWNEGSLSYVFLKEIASPLDVNIINGGNANVRI